MLEERVLHLLEQGKGEIITGGRLSRALGVSRTAIWKSIHGLQEKGHDIEALPASGYRLLSDSDGLSKQAIQAELKTRILGRRMELHPSLPSTNSYIKGQDTAALPEGYTVIADGQTAGRGRLGRGFCSPAREGVYMSVLLKPEIELSDVPMLTLCAAVAVCRAIDDVCGISTQVKWVNDIYFGGKKLCGILSEAFVSAELRAVEYAVVGIGVNTGDVDVAVREIATSVREAAGIRGIRNRLIAGILNQFEKIYAEFVSGQDRRAILDAYSERLFIIGRQVKVLRLDGCYSASVLGIDDAGGLLVRNTAGETLALHSGEINL